MFENGQLANSTGRSNRSPSFYTVHASKEEPQYLIKSDTTDHLPMHKGSAHKKLQK